jgi:dipeptidyl aminopeptidase/acylaminoacyl peptidase
VPFDPDHPRPAGARTLVLDDVFSTPNIARSWFGASATGTLVYVPGDPALGTLAWVDRDGTISSIEDQPSRLKDPSLSPDGTRVVLVEDFTLWMMELRRGTRTRLTLDDEGTNRFTAWSRDGTRVLFASNRSGDFEIYSVPAGGGKATLRLARPGIQFPLSEAPDGSLLFAERARGSATNLLVLSPDGAVTPFVVSPFSNVGGQFSPDGRTVAYVSDETGRDEVYVRSLARPGDVVGVSTDGGGAPRWSPDGKQLFYRRGDAFLVASVTSAGPLSVSDSRKLFEIRAAPGSSTQIPSYGVSPDGRRFLVRILDPRAIPTQINVVQNWFEELKAKVPVR